MNICLFDKQEINKPLSLKDPRGEHIVKVLHKKEGDEFNAGIIGGKAGKAVITSLALTEEKASNGKTFTSGSLEFEFFAETDGKPLNPLIMIIGFPRPIQLKRLLRDMAALGVKEVHLTATELSEKSYLESELATSEAGYKMLLDGTVQAASTHVPLLFRHKSLKECLFFINERLDCQESLTKIALDNVSVKENLGNFLKNTELNLKCKQNLDALCVAAIGSERGWTENERALLESFGYVRLGMGSRVMRTETASTVSASIILNEMGVLS